MSPAPTARDHPAATSSIGPRTIFESSPSRKRASGRPHVSRPPMRGIYPPAEGDVPGRTVRPGMIPPARMPSAAVTRLHARTRARRITR
jgi:hypothetical protein